MIKYLSKILYVLPAKKISLILLFLAFMSVSVMEAFGIGLIGPFINLATNPDIVTQNSWLNAAYVHSGVENINQFIALVGLLIVITFCVKAFFSWRVQTYVFVFSYEQQGKLIDKLIHSYLKAPYTFHLNKSSSHIIQNIINETKTFANSVLIPLLRSTSNLIIAVCLSVLLTLTNLLTVVVILGILLPIILLFHSFKDKIRNWGKQASRSGEETIRLINHGLGGIKETKVIGCEPYFEAQISEQQNIYVKSMGGFFAFKLLPRILVETLLVLFLVGFTSIALIFNQNIQELTALLSVFALASIRLIPAVSNLAGGVSTLRNASFSVNKLYTDLKELETLEINKDNCSVTNLSLDKSNFNNHHSSKELNFRQKIDLDVVSYHYPNVAENALNGISINIKKGESIALIGKSGAGKTTLVDVILGLLIPQNGDIKVDGKSIYADLRSWQNLIGYIPQSIFLIEDTIERNIAFGVPEHLIDRERINKAIKTAQLEELIERLPLGTQTMVGERGVLLSGGQRQRIGIARALYHEREILILDEATAALDNETENLITEAMQSLSGTKTLIIIAHRLTTVEHCNCIYMMERGKIVKSGTYQEVVLGTENTIEPKV